MAVQNDNTILNKGDLKAYHQKILPFLGGNYMMSTNNSNYYSTDEKVIGVWTDGKPLYQKTIIDTMPDNVTSGTMVNKKIDVSSLNIDKFANWFGMMKTSTGWCMLPHVDGSCNVTNGLNYGDSDSTLWLRNGNSFYNGATTYVTIQYTKTTDTASSALTTPGAYDINFPYTWPVDKEIYFGNGVYGKRNVRTTTTATNTQYVIQTGVSKIVDCGGTQWRTGDGYGHPMAVFPGGTAYPYFYIKGATMSGGTGELSIWGATVTMQGWDVWATYTK